MIVYTRIYQGIINTTAEQPYTGNTEDDYWIEHDDSVKYNIGDKYVKPAKSTNWQVSTMDNQPINYETATNQNIVANQTANVITESA
jgi:hypothetical protein